MLLTHQVAKTRDIPEDAPSFRNKLNYEERQQIANSAKNGVRNRRGRRMQVSSNWTALHQQFKSHGIH